MTTISWNDGNGNWGTAADWNPQVVPNSTSDDVVLGAVTGTPNYTVTLNFDVTVGSVTISNTQATLAIADPLGTDTVAGTFANSGTLQLDTTGGGGSTLAIGNTLTNSGQLAVGAIGNGAITTLTAAGIVNMGTMAAIGSSLSLTGDFSNSSRVQLDGTGGGGSTLSIGGVLTNTSVMTVGALTNTVATTITAAALVNGGNLELSGGSAGLEKLAVGASGISNTGTMTIIGGTVSTTGNFSNSGKVGFDAGGSGGDTMTIGGTLTVSGTAGFSVGDSLITQGVTVTAAALSDTSTYPGLGIYGGATVQSRVEIAGTAPTTLSGEIVLKNDALLHFAGGGGIATIASGAALHLTGANAIVASSDNIASNTALTGLTDNAGSLLLDSGATVTTTTDLTNSRYIFIEGAKETGGSTLAIGGTFTNTGVLDIGNNTITAPVSVSAQALVGPGQIFIFGNTGSAVQASVAINAPAPATWTGLADLGGDALFQFSSGGIATIAGTSVISLFGPTARIADAGTTGSSSALTGLSNVAGYLDLEAGASLVTNPGVDLTIAAGAGVAVDLNFQGPGGSTMEIGGTVTDDGVLKIGRGVNSRPSTVTAQGFVNNGQLFLGGGAVAAFDVNAPAPGTLTGASLLGYNALLQFASGGITTIASGAELILSGSNAFVAVAGATGSNSALVSLAGNAGTVNLENGAVVTTNAGVDFANSGYIQVGAGSPGGGGLVIGGSLRNTGRIDIGDDAFRGAAATFSAAGLVNAGTASILVRSDGGGATPVLSIGGSASNAGSIAAGEDSKVVIVGPLANTGNVQVVASFTPGSVDVTGDVSGAGGSFIIAGSAARLEFGGAVGSGQTVDFQVQIGVTAGTLALDDAGAFAGTIAGMGVGTSNTVPTDRIDLTGVAKSNVTGTGFDTTTDLLSVTTSNIGTLSFQLSGPYSPGTFADAISDGTGTDVFLSTVACYCRGTRIRTEAGEVPVEDLVIGDRVMTHSGATRPIKWIGRRSYDGRFIRRNPDVLPVIVKAGALGAGFPGRDLYLSPKHALYIDGVLVPAECLVDGISVVRCAAVERVDYFHIELAGHDVIFAEGAPAETFVDCDSRGMFHNAPEYAELYPDEMPERWAFCAPRVEEGEALAALRRRLDRRCGRGRFDREVERLLGRAVAAELASAKTAAALDPVLGFVLRQAAALIRRRAAFVAGGRARLPKAG